MENLVIYLFILLANIVAILLIYHSFDKNIEKTKKLVYTMIAMGVIYIAVLIIYFFSSMGLDKEVVKKTKNMITFSFVPVNAIILLPFLLRTFTKRKNKEITMEQLNKRAILVAIIAIILIAIEVGYFKSIVNGIVEIVNNKQEVSTNQETTNNIENSENTLNKENKTTNILRNFTVNTVQ